MRIAILGDVHANFPALRAVIAHALGKAAEEFWNLGDMIGYGPFPNEVVALLRQTCSRHVRGNYDSKCMTSDHADAMKVAGKDKDKIFSFEWSRRALLTENRLFIQQLPSVELVQSGRINALLAHGSSTDIEDGITPRSPVGKFRLLARDAVARNIQLLVFGHTHEFLDRMADGVRVINPGGVGRSFDGDPRASYCVLDIEGEKISCEHYRVAYAYEEMSRAMQSNGFSDRLVRSFMEAHSMDELDGFLKDDIEKVSAAAWQLTQGIQPETGHAVQVARLSLRLFDDLAGYYGLGWRERVLLNAAALLHDIGWAYGQEGHHKASRDLIAEDRSLPVSPRERIVIALIARYHCRSVPDDSHKFYKKLLPYEKEVVGILSAILRIADGLDRTHAARVREVGALIGRVRLTILVKPESGADVSAEINAAKKKADLLRKIFGVNIVMKKRDNTHCYKRDV